MFWYRGRKYKDLLEEKKPELAKLFKEKEENARKKQEERDRKEKELDEKGQWKYNNCDGEYYWSIPDENGHNMSLAEFNREDEDIPITIEQLRAMREPEEEYDEKYEEEYSQILREIYDPEGEERKRKRKEKKEKLKEELSRPIIMPDLGEKSQYEKVRDQTIRDRQQAMKESGMFNDTELENMLTSKIYE